MDVKWMVAIGLTLAQLRGQPVNPGAAIMQDFLKRVGDYVQLRKTAESKLPALRATPSSEKIEEHQKELAKRIAEARASAKPGDIFDPAIQKEFRRLLHLAMPPADAPRVRKSLQNAEPVAVLPQINHPYPHGIPIQSTPPSILANLPRLPPDIEYRLISHTLILWDAKTNLIIDYMNNAGL